MPKWKSWCETFERTQAIKKNKLIGRNEQDSTLFLVLEGSTTYGKDLNTELHLNNVMLTSTNDSVHIVTLKYC